jgi:hypothetical protein
MEWVAPPLSLGTSPQTWSVDYDTIIVLFLGFALVFGGRALALRSDRSHILDGAPASCVPSPPQVGRYPNTGLGTIPKTGSISQETPLNCLLDRIFPLCYNIVDRTLTTRPIAGAPPRPCSFASKASTLFLRRKWSDSKSPHRALTSAVPATSLATQPLAFGAPMFESVEKSTLIQTLPTGLVPRFGL